MTLRVLRPGMHTTIQDRGRWGYQRFGVPVAGAMDDWALRVANLLVGNAEDAATLEMTLNGPELVFEEETVFALAGADLNATVAERRIPPWAPAVASAGATLIMGGAATGARAYLAVAGGFIVPPVLGSRSTYVRAGLGGLEGRPLRPGDRLMTGAVTPLAERLRRALHAAPIARWGAGPSLRPRYADRVRLALVPGAQLDRLTPESRTHLFSHAYRISPQSDRMGFRLEGETLELDAPIDMLSEGVAFGTVQLPPGGQPIVLMADRQTTGGYPRLGEVATVDLPLLAQLRPGDEVRFQPCTVAEAQDRYLARERDLQQFMQGLSFI